MAPRKRPVKRSSTQAVNVVNVNVNTRGFAALADEIYLEIISNIPSVPIPTPTNVSSALHAEIRRSRHETLLSLSSTCRSLRRVFWRYLWQRIEVRQGMKVGGTNDTLGSPGAWGNQLIKNYAIELVRQLEIVTVRNPHLAQYVNYLDVFIGEYSFDTVLAELARCLSLFPNLHTIQVDVISRSRSRSWLANKSSLNKQSFGGIFKQTFKSYSYPQIRNVFVMSISKPLIASCPEATRVGSIISTVGSMPLEPSDLLCSLIDTCPRLEVLDECGDFISKPNMCESTIPLIAS
ncbi:hypothetical protein BYT27DRAFT_7076565 [Phlegmacium glaucopus]|nr:hypothetical protein BYT27DRAFT_7076565 [Phlegmacium glaucopus]